MKCLNDGTSTGYEVLKRLTQYLISPKYQPYVSWTGRGKGKERKFALSKCDHLVNFIIVTVNKIDSKFNRKKIEHELTYDILKRAPSKFGKPKASEQNKSPSSSSEESLGVSPIVMPRCVDTSNEVMDMRKHSAGTLPSSDLSTMYRQKNAVNHPPISYWDWPSYGAPVPYHKHVYPPPPPSKHA